MEAAGAPWTPGAFRNGSLNREKAESSKQKAVAENSGPIHAGTLLSNSANSCAPCLLCLSSGQAIQ